jgi:hypothetical protein
MANLVYNIRGTLWLDRRAALAQRPKPRKER